MHTYVINPLLHYLKLNNEFYLDIETDKSHIPSSLTEMINLDYQIPVKVDSSDQDPDLIYRTDDSFQEVDNTKVESEENPLDVYLISINKFFSIKNSHIGDEFPTITPGAGTMPLSILNECHCEELATSHLFPTGKFAYQVQRDILMRNFETILKSLLQYLILFFYPLSFAKIKF